MGEVELPLSELTEAGDHAGSSQSRLLRSSWYFSASSARVKNGLVVQPGQRLSAASTPSPSSPFPPSRLADSPVDERADLPPACSDGPPADLLSVNGVLTRTSSWGRVSLRLKKGLSTTSDLVQLGLERVDRVIPWLLKPQSDVVLGLELPCPPPEEDCISVCSWSELLDVEAIYSFGDDAEQEQEQLLEPQQLFTETVRWG